MSKVARAIQDVFETASLGAPEKAVGFVLWRVVHRYVREIDRALVDLDLTHLQFTTLAMAAWLGRSAEPVTQAEIARFAEIHPMQVSHMLKTLEAKRLVARSRNTLDVRAKRIEVTTAGVTALRRALPVAIDVQERLFGDDGHQSSGLMSALLRIANANKS